MEDRSGYGRIFERVGPTVSLSLRIDRQTASDLYRLSAGHKRLGVTITRLIAAEVARVEERDRLTEASV